MIKGKRGGTRLGAGRPEKYDGGTIGIRTTIPTKAKPAFLKFIAKQKKMYLKK